MNIAIRGVLTATVVVFALGVQSETVQAQTPMEIDTTSIDFGNVNVGNSSATMSVTLTNTDPAESFGPITIFGGAPATPEFGASQNCQGATLAPGETCSVDYTFTPSAPGTFNDDSNFVLSATANQADGEAFSVSLTGVGVNPITAAPLIHDFGNVNVGNTSGQLSTVITNTSGDPFGPLTIFGGAPATPEFGASQSCQGATLAPGGTCSVEYTFTPSTPGTFNDDSNFVISATESQADGEAFSVSLTGVGVNPITAAPLSHDFGSVGVGTTSSPLATVITNTSGDPFGPLTIFGGAPATPEFGASQSCQGATLAPGGTCSVEYTFTPSAPGTFNDDSNFVISATGSQADGEAFSVSLTGCGDAPGEPCPANSATFMVEKDFTDGNPAEVEVTLSCNTGEPMEQSTTIAEGDQEILVVTDFDSGVLDCSLTEAVPAGYAASYDDGSPAEDECRFEGVTNSAELSCVISNDPLAVDVAVTKQWFDEQLGEVVPEASASFDCEGEMFGPTLGTLFFSGVEDTESFQVVPHWNGGTVCAVVELVDDTSVESDDSGCASLSVMLGEGAACTITNTRFFKDIPTLSRLNLALLALLLALLGWVGIRRFARVQ